LHTHNASDQYKYYLYKYFVDRGYIDTLDKKIVVFEFMNYSRHRQTLTLTIVQNKESTYRLQDQNDVKDYEELLAQSLEKNYSLGALYIANDYNNAHNCWGKKIILKEYSTDLTEESIMKNKICDGIKTITVLGIDINLAHDKRSQEHKSDDLENHSAQNQQYKTDYNCY